MDDSNDDHLPEAERDSKVDVMHREADDEELEKVYGSVNLLQILLKF